MQLFGELDMSLAIWWKRESKPGLIIMFLGLSGLVHIPVLYVAQVYLKLLSIEVQILVTIGSIAVLAAAFVLMAESMYRWNARQLKKKRKKRQVHIPIWSQTKDFAMRIMRMHPDMPALVGALLITLIFWGMTIAPLGYGMVALTPPQLAHVAILDPIFKFPLLVNIASITSIIIATLMNEKVK